MNEQRAILYPHALEYVPRPGEREIRMHPTPTGDLSRPREGGAPDV